MLDCFRNPPAEFRVAPLWFWNARPNRAEIECQIREMHAKGVGGFFIQGSPGLSDEIGEEWACCVETATELAHQLGMRVHVCDQNPCPVDPILTGTPGTNDSPIKFLDIAGRAVGPQETVFVPLPEGELLWAVAVPVDDSADLIDLTDAVADRTLTWTSPPGRFQVLTFVATPTVVAGFLYSAQPVFFDRGQGETAADQFRDILKRFDSDHGYDLTPHLACLATDAGRLTGKVRRDFWATVSHHYAKHYLGRYLDWCESNGVIPTGHQFDSGDPCAVKLASSNAHMTRSPRVLSEAFARSGWTLSMQQMKQTADWQHSLGVNALSPQAFYYTIAGVLATEAPPSQFCQATYWEHYRAFADYAARLSCALSKGKHVAKIALLYPIKGFHSEWVIGTRGRLDTIIADYFDLYCSHLLKQHIDYDIIDEQAVQRASCIDQQLIVSGERYEMLIMPPTTAVGLETAIKIREFADDGGYLLGTALLPVEDADGDRHEQVRKIFAALFARDPAQIRDIAGNSIPARGHALTHSADNILFFESPDPADLAPVLRAHISTAIKPEVSVRWNGRECQDITYLHRSFDDAQIYFFASASPEPREAQLSIRCANAPYVLDPESGEAYALPNCTQQGGRTVLLHRFESHGSLLVYFGSEPALAVSRQHDGLEGMDLPLSTEWRFSTIQPNCLPLGKWQLTEETNRACETRFDVADLPSELALVVDGPQFPGLRVFVNGIEALDKRPLAVDQGFASIDIAPLAHKGANVLRIQTDRPAQIIGRLMGSFSLDASSATIVSPRQSMRDGSWTDQGYPFYSGTAVYAQSFSAPILARGQRIFVRAESPADTVEFCVNGEHAGVRAWAPFEVEITHLAEPGTNELEIRVTNSLANQALSQAVPSGLIKGASVTIY